MRVLNGCLQVIVALLIARAVLWLYTQGNDFPVDYHPDEAAKADQITSPDQTRNFNHPLLMLEAANLARQGFDVPVDDQRAVVLIGRWTSAALGAAGIFAIALAGAIAYGWVGLLICGAIMALFPGLLVCAHYFKEDPSLLFGIMVSILGARLLLSAKRDLTQVLAAAFMGVGCGLATSGKFVGAGTLFPCVIALLIARARHWFDLPMRLVAFAIFAYATVVVVNYREFLDWTSFQLVPFAAEKISTEYDHGTTGHGASVLMGMNTPNTYCLGITLEDMMPHLWAMAAVGLLWLIFHPRISRWGITLLVFLVTFTVEMSFNAIPFERYALPISLCMFIVVAMLMSRMLYDLMLKRKLCGMLALTACLAVIVFFQYRRCAYFNNEFRNDGRQRLREWIAENVPPGSTVIADRYANLGSDGDRWRFPNQKPMSIRLGNPNGLYAANVAATPQEMAEQGVDYVAVAEASYRRFLVPAVHGLPGSEPQYDRLKRFYEDLFSHDELLVWSSGSRVHSHSFAGQEMRLYRIAKLAGR